jgi:Spy/CpxP family protein refolding chaperone
MRVSQRLAAVMLTGILSLSVASGAFAQKGGGRRGGGTYPPALLNQLNLNADQQAKVKAAADAYRAEQVKFQALPTPKEKRQAQRAARGTYESAVRAALDADQQKKLQTIVAEAREYRGMGPMGMQLAALDLNADQKTKVKGIAAKYEPELQKARAGAGADKKAARMATREVNAKMRTEVMTVLTPEQQKQLRPAGKVKKKNNQ